MVGVLVSLPELYFASEQPVLTPAERARRLPYFVGKNMGGIALVMVGLVLALPGVPGQGLMMVATGLLLLDFPGQRQLVRRLLSRPAARSAVSRLRGWFGKPPLVIEAADAAPTKAA
jgi:hypothetical protein